VTLRLHLLFCYSILQQLVGELPWNIIDSVRNFINVRQLQKKYLGLRSHSVTLKLLITLRKEL